MTDQTLFLIKPNAVQHKHIGHIISIVEENGFVLRNIKIIKFDCDSAGVFYAMHKGKEFYDRLVSFMCSGDTIALHLSRRNAVQKLRELVGDADPDKREQGTIRSLYAEGITENAVHASDSDEAAAREIELIFGDLKALA